MIRNSSGGGSRNSYRQTPFRRNCRVTITNEGRKRVSNLYYHVDWGKFAKLPDDAGYLHAHYEQQLPPAKDRPFTVLDVKGRGVYVGTVLNVLQAERGWLGEGDEFIYLDGAKKASIEGTGTEDYFNDAWTLRVSDGPYTGVSIGEGGSAGSRLSAYRWQIPDPIPQPIAAV